MSVTEILQSARFVVDSSGNRQAVQLDLDTWEAVLELTDTLRALMALKKGAQAQ
jgi:hypothetical protein